MVIIIAAFKKCFWKNEIILWIQGAWGRRGGWLENRICSCLRAELCCCFSVNAPIIDYFIQTSVSQWVVLWITWGRSFWKCRCLGPTPDSQGQNLRECLYLTQITTQSSCILGGESLWYRIQLSILSLPTLFQPELISFCFEKKNRNKQYLQLCIHSWAIDLLLALFCNMGIMRSTELLLM